jgi:hypothetical protein
VIREETLPVADIPTPEELDALDRLIAQAGQILEGIAALG